ncbi:translocation/assembly module TamB domain-containing protein [Roseimarinus sediminis]|uniref:translocation/assembly module TamB domain-containing protein n=1 Tax=Roseimarinus sediminis TaxID=1610899 RepID=UPI003D24298F
MKNILFHILKVILILVKTMLVLLLLMALFSQTKTGKRKIIQQSEKYASQLINGRLEIGELKGNLLTGFSLHNILLTGSEDTIAQVASIDISYHLAPLFRRSIVIESIHIDQAYLHLSQNKDSLWNFNQLLLPSSPNDSSEEKTIPEFSFQINQFRLLAGNIRLNALDTLLPQAIENIGLLFSLEGNSKQQKLQLQSFSFSSLSPDLDLKHLSFLAEHQQSSITLSDFYLKTAKNQLEANGSYQEDDQLKADLHLRSKDIMIEEFELFLPDFSLPVHPSLNVNAMLEGDTLSAQLRLVHENEIIQIELRSDKLLASLNQPDSVALHYLINAQLENVKPESWITQLDPGHQLNGKLKVEGRGTDPSSAIVGLVAQFNNSVLNNQKVEQLEMNLNLNKAKLDALIDGQGSFGRFHLDASVNQLTTFPDYSIRFNTRQLNLADILSDTLYQSSLNLNGEIEGKGIQPKELRASGMISASNADVFQIRIDSMLSSFQFEEELLTIDSLWIQSDSLLLTVDGTYRLNQEFDLMLHAAFSKLDLLKPITGLETFNAKGNLETHLWGLPDTINMEASASLQQIEYDSLTLESLELNTSGIIAGDTSFTVKARATALNSGSTTLDSLLVSASYNQALIDLSTLLYMENLHSDMKAAIELDSSIVVQLREWETHYNDQSIRLVNVPSTITLSPESYLIENFRLIANHNENQYFHAEGLISQKEVQDFRLEIHNFDLAFLSTFIPSDYDVQGLLGLQLELSGQANAPAINSHFDLQNASFNTYPLTRFDGSLAFKQENLLIDAMLIPHNGGALEMKGTVPMQIRLDSMNFNLPDDSIHSEVSISNFPLEFLKVFTSITPPLGTLNGTINLGGTLENPLSSGQLQLSDASWKVPEYGIDYNQIVLNVHFDNSSLNLDTLLIQSGNGKMLASGSTGFQHAIYSGAIENSKVNVLFDRFTPFNHRQFNIEISGDAALTGTRKDMVFDGALTIPSASIYLPAVIAIIGNQAPPEIKKPILVKELEKLRQTTDSLLPEQAHSTVPDSAIFSFGENINGKLKIKIPKNTWIKNEAMRIELSGDLEMIKNARFTELFGTVDVVRGQYELLGKTFIIDEGLVSFEGGEDFNPRVNLLASYSFRNSKRMQEELLLRLSGKLNEPEVYFSMNDQQVSEGDALSYLLFGKSLNELSLNQQQDLNQAGGSELAAKAASSLLTSQLNKVLGEKLNVDYIELSSNGEFDNATVVLGKYLTNDLFVSYEQHLGNTDEKGIDQYEVKLEYELFKFLFLQLNNSTSESGFDVIFKFDSKK